MPPRPRDRQHPKTYVGRDCPAFTIDGRRVKRSHAIAAIESGQLIPANDALFDDDCQSWVGCAP